MSAFLREVSRKCDFHAFVGGGVMRFLVDECTGPVVAQWLREQGYDVFSVFEESRMVYT